ncbi:fasciclin-like arabinogalactan protein 1 [Canna indica]|uniref:Fasciclin-like arabinogalactan protein 1 n=1 Tax=Canna indica TaxID=4628 RepID=A0AAQ3QFK5_9LILI|nr:fasciclin-like arabinogalactan protein 1 [Canna indica]
MRPQQHFLVLILCLLQCVPLFQASAAATGSVRISTSSHTKEIAHHRSVIHISKAVSSPAAKAPAAPAAPTPVDITAVMAKKGCGTFAGLVDSIPDAAQTFASNVDGGLTAFCPLDHAMKPFLPKYKNLTADGKLSLLLYHAVPVYYSVPMLKTGNGVVNTLATDGTSKNYNITVQNEGDQVTLKTRLTVATITTTLMDKDPVAIYAIDEVLEPAELFKPVEAPAPAPAPEPSKKKKAAPKARKSSKASPPAPAGPEGQPADQTAADDESPARRSVVGWSAAAATLVAALVMAA